MNWKLETQNGQVGKPENQTLLKAKEGKENEIPQMLNSET